MIFDLLIPSAIAQAPEAQQDSTFSLILFGGLFVLMYFLIIRPQRKRQKDHKNLVDSLAVGDEVVLSSGLVGKIVKLDEHYAHIAQDTDTTSTIYQKAAIHAILPKGTLKSIK